MILQKYEINAFSLEEAKEKAHELGMSINRNVTQSWKNNNSPTYNNDLKLFAVDMLDKHHITEAGIGIIIVIEPGSKDTRQKPYTFVNNVVLGPKEKQRVFEVRTKDSNQLVCETLTKDEAIRKAKEAMIDFKEDMVCKVYYKVLNGKDVAFNLNYTPSASTKEGKYLVFGFINE